MRTGPTRGAKELQGPTWHSRPIAAKAVRGAAFLLPLLAAWLSVRLTSHWFFQTEGALGVLVWIVQSLAVGFVGSFAVDRLTRRLLPLASLLTLSLVFPDQAPSRFGLALRSGTVRQLKRRLTEVQDEGLGDDVQEAAVAAVGLVTALGQHDRLTRGHTERVRAYADVIGEELDLPAHDRAMLSWGALLHDVGKMAVPAEILNKDGRPTDGEWEVLKNHPAASADILAPLASWLGPWIGAATEHHERWDGAGYPRGLAGHDISLAGRITAVADTYDVITSKRSYKKPMSAAAARQELVRCARSQFDPEIVRAFVNVSLGRRWLPGPLASLLELPAAGSAVQVVTRAPAVVASSAAVVGSIAAGVTDSASFDLWQSDGPEVVAMVEEADDPDRTTFTLPVATTITLEMTSSTGDDQPTTSLVVDGDTTSSSVSSTPTTTTTTTTPTTTTTTTTTTPTTTTTTTTPTTTTPTTTTTTTTPTTTTPSGSWAVADTVSGPSGEQVVIDVLQNDDLPADVDYGSIAISQPASHGTVTINVPPGNPANTKLRYRSNPDFVGTDSFEYEICDSSGTCATATVTITVTD